MKVIRTGMYVVAMVMALPLIGRAQDMQKDAQNKLLAKRAAEADAYRKLGETIQGLQITSETHVRDFVTESDQIHSDFDGFVRGVRFGKPKWDSEGTCSIEAEVTVAKIIEELKSLHSRHYKGNTLKAEDFNQITTYVKKDIIKAVGMGAPRADLPPEVPGGDIPMPAGVSAPPPVIPALWKQVPPNERLMAARAAELDGKRKLVERIKGLRISSSTHVRDFVAESDVIDAEAQATLTGAHQVGNPYYHDDELIVEVTVEVPVESVITTIKSLHKRHYKGDQVTGTDIEHVTNELKSQKFDAVGMGVPRAPVIAKIAIATQTQIPDWASKKIRADGNGVPPADKAGTPQGKLMAARAAEIDAKRRLAEEVMGFQIDSSTTVKDFVTEHDEINTNLNAYITDSYVTSTKYDGEGTATVTVEMPAMQIWEIVHTFIKVQKMQP
jgi:hypothetical protein